MQLGVVHDLASLALNELGSGQPNAADKRRHTYDKAKITFKATVKDHSERDGVKQTIVTRAKLNKESEVQEDAIVVG